MDAVKLRNRWLIRLLTGLTTFLAKVLFWTCRVEVIEQVPGVSPYRPATERFLYCNWHDGILGAIFSGRVCDMAALTSQHMDGDIVEAVMHAVGIHPVRGSSSRGGAGAMKQMLAKADDYHITIATDGPRGPRRVVKQGIIFLASHAGRRIVPIAFAAARAWRPRGKWTDLVIPVPFSKVYAIGGEPMSVPANLSRDQLEQHRAELQRRIDDLNAVADELAGVPVRNDWPARSIKKKAA